MCCEGDAAVSKQQSQSHQDVLVKKNKRNKKSMQINYFHDKNPSRFWSQVGAYRWTEQQIQYKSNFADLPFTKACQGWSFLGVLRKTNA